MRIAVVSLNVDQLKESPGKEISEVLDSNPDYYVEFTQEDSRKPDGPGLQGDVPGGLLLVAENSMNKVKSPQNILTKVYSNRTQNVKVTMGTIPLAIRNATKYKALLAVQTILGKTTKGAVWIHLQYQTYSLLFINLHLPVMTKVSKKTGELVDPTLGFEYRKQSLMYILEKLQYMIRKTTFTTIGGDLNFRMDASKTNQLTTLLDRLPEFKEFPFPDDSSKTYTCKFTSEEEYNEKVNTTMKNSSNEEKEQMKSQFEECRLSKIKNVNKRQLCHDEERIPSRCDRFLYNGAIEPTVEKQDSMVYLPTSDHNALYLVFTLDNPRFNAYGKPLMLVNKSFWNYRSKTGGTRRKQHRRLEKTRKHH
jgi:hypothetical protein